MSPAEIAQFEEVQREKRRQKEELVLLSNNSIVVNAPQSGHHIQLEDPGWLTTMLMGQLDTVRRRLELAAQHNEVTATTVARAPVPEDGRTAILRAFRQYPVVLLGESHRSAEMHAFLRALVASPEFARIVDDVVLEATNVRYQPILDRFIAGDSVPRDSLRQVWRNTTQLLLWDSPLYEELVETIRAVNQTLPPAQKLRALASDPPIDWNTVRTARDFPRAYGYRDWQTTEVIEREVLARKRRALVVIGSTHVRRVGPRADSLPVPPERESVGEALARKHPEAAYAIETVVGRGNPGLAAIVRDLAPSGTLLRVTGTSLASRSSSLLFGRNITLFRIVDGRRVPVTIDAALMPPLGAAIDAVLYLGAYSHQVLPDAALYLNDPGYLTEVRRRIGILTQVYGGDFWTDELEAVLRCRR